MRDYTTVFELYRERHARLIPAACAAVAAAGDAGPRIQLFALAEAAGALSGRARRLDEKQPAVARARRLDAARLFACAQHVADAADEAWPLVLIALHELSGLGAGAEYHDRLAAVLERAAVAVFTLEPVGGVANLTAQARLAAFGSALLDASAAHQFLADRHAAGCVPARRTQALERAMMHVPEASTTRPAGAPPAGALFEYEHDALAAAANELSLTLKVSDALPPQLPEPAPFDVARLRAEIWEDWERECPDEPWEAYTPAERAALAAVRRLPNRLVRERVEEHARLIDPSLTIARLARRLGIADARSLARSLGLAPVRARRCHGRLRPAYWQRTITVELARQIFLVLHLPAEEVPGL
jgi:hypothetical protein